MYIGSDRHPPVNRGWEGHNRGGGNCFQTPPCKQRGGRKAGTGVVKYTNQDILRPQAIKGSLLHQICIINQSVLDPYQFQNLSAAGAF